MKPLLLIAALLLCGCTHECGVDGCTFKIRTARQAAKHYVKHHRNVESPKPCSNCDDGYEHLIPAVSHLPHETIVNARGKEVTYCKTMIVARLKQWENQTVRLSEEAESTHDIDSIDLKDSEGNVFPACVVSMDKCEYLPFCLTDKPDGWYTVIVYCIQK